jgi:uncharacterized protein (TIGR02757 family)
VDKRLSEIREVLERLYARYNRRECINPDPLQFVYRYTNRGDMEVAGFLAASLAYGRVEQIEKSLDELLGFLGESPFEFVKNFDEQKKQRLDGFKHRFTTGRDISDLLSLLKDVLAKYASIEKFFVQGYSKGDKNIIGALSKFCQSLLGMYSEKYGASAGRGLRYLLVTPARGSACKRLNLFLRWMIRDDDVDAGLWKSIEPSALVVPVDVHMARLCRVLGFYQQKTVSLSAALKITESFAEIEPSEPVKYDFALSRIGILDNCTGRHRSGCEFCELFGFCFDEDRV